MTNETEATPAGRENKTSNKQTNKQIDNKDSRQMFFNKYSLLATSTRRQVTTLKQQK